MRMGGPDARSAGAQGQRDTHTLARTRRDFERGKYDILLSTTIIENGVDIPRANTIFIDRADLFGMADLYQLRGRVGRSSRQGYAYFLLPPSGLIDEEAGDGLAPLTRHAGLGVAVTPAVRQVSRWPAQLESATRDLEVALILRFVILNFVALETYWERSSRVISLRLGLVFIVSCCSAPSRCSAAKKCKQLLMSN